jgi:ABC-type multidrug transport system ATPase subunit
LPVEDQSEKCCSATLVSLFERLKSKLKSVKGLSYTEVEQSKLLRDRLNNSLLRENFESTGHHSSRSSSRKHQQQQKARTKRHILKSKCLLFDQEPLNLSIGVAIQNLTKKYDNSKLAVDNLTINFYESQITSFLGHNGAGKTTTLSMLTGLIPVTSGHALIYGKDICTDINSIRNSLGWCPQHNVLFDKLTVEEHLWFYAKLKHMNASSIQTLIENMLRDTDLKKKRNNLINTLSGGMQRKLSVAIAFVGDAKLVILDEPTAGVDPYARRAIWDLLLKYKHGRTIILSTHHMDEAELLGDRIAIISNGKLQCCGTALFLKNALGEGNNLTLTKSLDSQADEEDTSQGRSILTNFMRSYIPSVFLKEETLREYQFVIPLHERSNQNFWNLFKALEENKFKLKIDSYGIHDVSLEEIFLKAAQIKSSEEKRSVLNGENDNDDRSILLNKTRENNSTNEDEEAEGADNGKFSSRYKQDESLYDLDYIYCDLEKGYRLYFKQVMAIVTKR